MTESQLTPEDIIAELPGEPQPGVRKPALPHTTEFLDEDEYTPEEYEAMLLMYEETLSNVEEGEIVKARVLRVT